MENIFQLCNIIVQVPESLKVSYCYCQTKVARYYFHLKFPLKTLLWLLFGLHLTDNRSLFCTIVLKCCFYLHLVATDLHVELNSVSFETVADCRVENALPFVCSNKCCSCKLQSPIKHSIFFSASSET